MDKRILEEYIDACEVIRETEAEIRKLKTKRVSLQMRQYLEAIQNFPIIHNTSKCRERYILMQMTAGLGQRKRS